ncbi:DUF2336 domain-containing protein [Breoghania sp. JC706]|uniref:DUF2336 domain-containing protein n=1 Tax=Breoghania sp. JC706 TaxID=3117732 RepID=UPI00300B07AE
MAGDAPTKIERHVYAELFRQYVDGTPVSERRQVATLLSRCAFAPHDCVLRLAQDEDVSVAHRVLAYSQVLSDCDLIAAIGRGPGAIRRAISLRNDVSDKVLTALRRHESDAEASVLPSDEAAESPGPEETTRVVRRAPAATVELAQPEPGEVEVAASAAPDEADEPDEEDAALRARAAGADAVLQALKDMARPGGRTGAPASREPGRSETATADVLTPDGEIPANEIRASEAPQPAMGELRAETDAASGSHVWAADVVRVERNAAPEADTGRDYTDKIAPDFSEILTGGKVLAEVVRALAAEKREARMSVDEQISGAGDDEPPARAEFGLRRRPPVVASAPESQEPPESQELVEDPAPADERMPERPAASAASQVVFRAPPRPEPMVAPVSAREERTVQPGTTLAPRAGRTAPTPGYAAAPGKAPARPVGPDFAPEAKAAAVGAREIQGIIRERLAGRGEPAVAAPALDRFLNADAAARMDAIAAAQTRVLAEAAASRVRMRSKIDAELVACLERTAAHRDMETLRGLLAQTLKLPAATVERIIADPSGEPLLVVAAAIGLPTSRTVSMLLQVSPAAFSLARVRELAALRAHLDIRVARHLVGQWTGLAPRPAVRPAVRPAGPSAHHAPVLDDAMRSRRDTIVRTSQASRENAVDEDGVLVLRNIV